MIRAKEIPEGQIACEDCEGAGTQTCGNCDSSGQVTETCNLDYDHEHECGDCEGTGNVDCGECDGSGHMDDPDYEVDIDL